MNAHALRYSLLSAFVAATLAACGGAAPSAKAPESLAEPEVEPATVEEAQQQIARAQSRLPGGSSKTADRPASTESSPPSKPAPAPPPPAEPLDTRPDAHTKNGAGDTCSSPCRALASMRRAVTALCRMTGDTDSRCVDARRTLTDSEGRVTPCTC
jgi:hypothetical protein